MQKHTLRKQQTNYVGQANGRTVGNISIVQLLGARLVQQKTQAAVRQEIARVGLARLCVLLYFVVGGKPMRRIGGE